MLDKNKTLVTLASIFILGVSTGYLLSQLLKQQLTIKAGAIYFLDKTPSYTVIVVSHTEKQINITRLQIYSPTKVKVKINLIGSLEKKTLLIYIHNSNQQTNIISYQKTLAVKILYNNQETRKLLESGYKIDRIKPLQVNNKINQNKVIAVLVHNEKMYIIVVDLLNKNTETVLRLENP